MLAVNFSSPPLDQHSLNPNGMLSPSEPTPLTTTPVFGFFLLLFLLVANAKDPSTNIFNHAPPPLPGHARLDSVAMALLPRSLVLVAPPGCVFVLSGMGGQYLLDPLFPSPACLLIILMMLKPPPHSWRVPTSYSIFLLASVPGCRHLQVIGFDFLQRYFLNCHSSVYPQ